MNPNVSTKKNDGKRDLIGNALMLSATIFFGINVPVMKILIPHWLSAFEVTAFRFIGGAALLWLTSLFTKNEKIDRQDYGKLLLGGVLVWGFLTLFSWAFDYASAIDISIIMVLPPIMVVVINSVFRHFKVGWLEWVGVCISFIGAAVLILVRSSSSVAGQHNLIGEFLALGSSLCYAFYLIVMEKPSAKYKSLSLMRWVLGIAGVLCIPFVFRLPKSMLFEHPAAWPIGLVCFAVLLATYYSYMVEPPAIRMIGSEMVSMYQYLVPVIAAVASLIMKVETLVWYQPVSMAIIIAGVVLADISKRKVAKKLGKRQD